MYKTITVHDKVYQQLNLIALRLNKPKTQVVEMLVEKANESLRAGEVRDLDIFNSEMKALFEAKALGKKVEVRSRDLPDSIDGLKDIDFKSF